MHILCLLPSLSIHPVEVPHFQSVVWGPAALPYVGNLLEIQNLGPSIDLLHQNLHFSKSSGWFTCTLNPGKPCPRGMSFPPHLLAEAPYCHGWNKEKSPCGVTVEGKKHALSVVVKRPFTLTHSQMTQSWVEHEEENLTKPMLLLGHQQIVTVLGQQAGEVL